MMDFRAEESGCGSDAPCGLGTFQNISVEDYREHKMHGEHYEITQENADIINNARKAGGRISPSAQRGTRVIETVAKGDGTMVAQKGVTCVLWTSYHYKVADGLLTNFHWPKSSLILLVAAFTAGKTHSPLSLCGGHKLHLFSHGDGMLIL